MIYKKILRMYRKILRIYMTILMIYMKILLYCIKTNSYQINSAQLLGRLCHAEMRVLIWAGVLCPCRRTMFFACAGWLCRPPAHNPSLTPAHNPCAQPERCHARVPAHNLRTTCAQPPRTTSAHNTAHNPRAQPPLHNQPANLHNDFFNKIQ